MTRPELRILLTDLDGALTREWERHIDLTGVSIYHRDIFSEPVDALVSPANSFGFMDGGIDLVYTRRFGWHVQHRVQQAIQEKFGGELLVEQALIVKTDNADFPNLISAPTMRVPMKIQNVVDVRLSTRAAVKCAIDGGMTAIAMPGMGTLTGQVHAPLAARLMREGIMDAINGTPFPASWQEAAHDHSRALREYANDPS